jgi:predicted exporter
MYVDDKLSNYEKKQIILKLLKSMIGQDQDYTIKLLMDRVRSGLPFERAKRPQRWPMDRSCE